jgi:hypothetical protein
MMLLRILGGFFLVFVISRVVLRWRDRSLLPRELIFWVFVFGGILTVLLVPALSGRLARFFGITRGADLVVYGSVVLLYYLVFRMYVSLENITYKLTLLVREIALAQSEELSSMREMVTQGEASPIEKTGKVQQVG